MTYLIHPSAVVEPGATLGLGCRVGPYCYVGPHVTIGSDNVLHAHSIIDGHTTMGDANEVFPFSCVGTLAEDMKYRRGSFSSTHIGSGNIFREYCTVNASAKEEQSTVIGDKCLFLSYSHIAHDCIIGSHVLVGCDTKLAGHVQLDDHAIINGKTGVVQFVRIGKFAFVGGMNKVTKDVLPFCVADGYPSFMRGVNKIGLERNGFSLDQIRTIRSAYRILLRMNLPLRPAIVKLRLEYGASPEVQTMVAFAESSVVGLARPRNGVTTPEGSAAWPDDRIWAES